jgi:hypothetical protein
VNSAAGLNSAHPFISCTCLCSSHRYQHNPNINVPKLIDALYNPWRTEWKLDSFDYNVHNVAEIYLEVASPTFKKCCELFLHYYSSQTGNCLSVRSLVSTCVVICFSEVSCMVQKFQEVPVSKMTMIRSHLNCPYNHKVTRSMTSW